MRHSFSTNLTSVTAQPSIMEDGSGAQSPTFITTSSLSLEMDQGPLPGQLLSLTSTDSTIKNLFTSVQSLNHVQLFATP